MSHLSGAPGLRIALPLRARDRAPAALCRPQSEGSVDCSALGRVLCHSAGAPRELQNGPLPAMPCCSTGRAEQLHAGGGPHCQRRMGLHAGPEEVLDGHPRVQIPALLPRCAEHGTCCVCVCARVRVYMCVIEVVAPNMGVSINERHWLNRTLYNRPKDI